MKHRRFKTLIVTLALLVGVSLTAPVWAQVTLPDHWTQNNASSTDPALRITQMGTGPVLRLDYSGSNGTGLYAVANSGANAKAVYGFSTDGYAGYFQGKVAVTAGFYVGQLNASTTSSQPTVGATNVGYGKAGDFRVNKTNSEATALYAATNGTGRAAYFEITNTASTADVLYSKHNGRGTAGRFESARDGLIAVTTGSSYDAITATANGGTSAYALDASSTSGRAVNAVSTSGYGLYASSSTGWAGYFSGKVYVSGNLGIGTSSPQQRLSVSAGMNIDQSNANSGTLTNGLMFGSSSGEGIASKRTSGGNQYGLDFYTDFTNRMCIRQNGNVGIGTTSPTEKLHVTISGNSGRAGYFVSTSTSNTSAPLSATSSGNNGIGFSAYCNTGSNAWAVYGSSSQGYAGYFSGKGYFSGVLTKAGGGFKIDHPLDPAGKYLTHSFVESPDMKNVYDGVVYLDGNGEAWVELPDWFEALNSDFRYQLTAIGAPAPNLYVAEEISGNAFKIAGGPAGIKVSWQVTGIRQDAWANANRLPVEEDKPEGEVGTYLHPECFGQPLSMSVESVKIADKDR